MSLLCNPLFSPLQVAQHVSGNCVPINRSWRLSSFSPRVGIVPWLQEGCQNQLAGSVSIEEFVIWTPQWTHYLLTGSNSLSATTAQHQHAGKHYSVVSFWRWAHSCLKHVDQLVKEKIKDCTKVTFSWFLIHTQ